MFTNQVKQMMVKGALLKNSLQSKVQKPLVQHGKRQFSNGTTLSTGNKLALGVGAASITGLTYLSYLGHKARVYAPPQ